MTFTRALFTDLARAELVPADLGLDDVTFRLHNGDKITFDGDLAFDAPDMPDADDFEGVGGTFAHLLYPDGRHLAFSYIGDHPLLVLRAAAHIGYTGQDLPVLTGAQALTLAVLAINTVLHPDSTEPDDGDTLAALGDQAITVLTHLHMSGIVR